MLFVSILLLSSCSSPILPSFNTGTEGYATGTYVQGGFAFTQMESSGNKLFSRSIMYMTWVDNSTCKVYNTSTIIYGFGTISGNTINMYSYSQMSPPPDPILLKGPFDTVTYINKNQIKINNIIATLTTWNKFQQQVQEFYAETNNMLNPPKCPHFVNEMVPINEFLKITGSRFRRT